MTHPHAVRAANPAFSLSTAPAAKVVGGFSGNPITPQDAADRRRDVPRCPMRNRKAERTPGNTPATDTAVVRLFSAPAVDVVSPAGATGGAA